MLRSLALISTRQSLQQQLTSAVAVLSEPPKFTLLDNVEMAIAHLEIELPALCLLDADDPNIDTTALFRAIAQDSWLLQTGLLVIYENPATAQALEQQTSGNIIQAVALNELETKVPVVLDIIEKNRRLIFQRGLGQNLMQTLYGSFKLANDPLAAEVYVKLICNFLYQAGRLNQAGSMKLRLALTEMLINAIEHGNCEISFAEKAAWLEADKPMRTLVAQRNSDQTIAQRRVHFEYALLPDEATFTVADEGQGFDWREHLKNSETDDFLALHGRGIMMSRSVTDSLEFNDIGNQVKFSIHYEKNATLASPQLIQDLPVCELSAGDIVFREGDEGDELYFISSGSFEVTTDGKTLAQLNADDMFIGDMSFLLNGNRHATVTALEPSRLITISRAEFIRALRKYPQYGLVLARLLAQRLWLRNTADNTPANL